MVAIAAHRAWRRARDKLFSLAARRSFAAFGPRSVIALPTRIDGEQRMALGADVFVGPSSWLHALSSGGDPPGRITIGNDVKATSRLTVSAARSVEIGDGVLLAAGVYIADHGHRFGDPGVPVHHQGVTEPAPVVIGRNAWIGQNAVILSGVTIGEGAVVGSNAVVTDDVPPGAVAVGVPATSRRRNPPAG